jgi:predicted nucleic acid-binding protein
MYLLDTNIFIHFLENSIPKKGSECMDSINDGDCRITVISKIETLGYVFVSKSSEDLLSSFVNPFFAEELSHSLVEKTIECRKKYKIKLADSIIATSAIVLKFTLITRDKKDFSKVKEMKIISPFEL